MLLLLTSSCWVQLILEMIWEVGLRLLFIQLGRIRVASLAHWDWGLLMFDRLLVWCTRLNWGERAIMRSEIWVLFRGGLPFLILWFGSGCILVSCSLWPWDSCNKAWILLLFWMAWSINILIWACHWIVPKQVMRGACILLLLLLKIRIKVLSRPCFLDGNTRPRRFRNPITLQGLLISHRCNIIERLISLRYHLAVLFQWRLWEIELVSQFSIVKV